MTNEEAREILEEIKTLDDSLYQYNQKYMNALDMAIQALEIQSEDCISREAVNTLVDELARVISDERCHMPRGRSTATIMGDILQLPSVTPKQKYGEWICVDDYHMGKFKCSVCQTEGFPNTVMYKPIWNFCPNCGAKMKPQESGNKE